MYGFVHQSTHQSRCRYNLGSNTCRGICVFPDPFHHTIRPNCHIDTGLPRNNRARGFVQFLACLRTILTNFFLTLATCHSLAETLRELLSPPGFMTTS